MVNVQVGSLSAFKKDVLPLAPTPVQQLGDVAGIGSKLLAISEVLISNLVVV